MAPTVAETRDFFGTAAQVIPLFALAVLAERRLRVRGDAEEPTPSVGPDAPTLMVSTLLVILFAVSAALAEASALHGLAYRPTLADRHLVIGGLTISGVTLFVDVVLMWIARHQKASGHGWQSIVVVAFGAAVVVTGVLLAAITWFTAT
jgi:small-conductance mechanosensitive channel